MIREAWPRWGPALRASLHAKCVRARGDRAGVLIADLGKGVVWKNRALQPNNDPFGAPWSAAMDVGGGCGGLIGPVRFLLWVTTRKTRMSICRLFDIR